MSRELLEKLSIGGHLQLERRRQRAGHTPGSLAPGVRIGRL